MNKDDFRPGSPGTLVRAEEGVLAFVPDPLPPKIGHGPELTREVAEAQESMGRLDSTIPETTLDPYILVYPLLQREAYYSSLMEGTHTTPRRMALFPMEEAGEAETRSEDHQTREVFNYVNAMENGLRMVKKEGRPIQHSVILELHRRLMSGVRGGDERAGDYRAVQNYIGREVDGIRGARFVPPPPLQVRPLMDDLLGFLTAQVGRNAPLSYPVALALAHYQFETIHPFTDGNGRIGRLLIPLVLVEKGLMREPILHVSPWLEHRNREYRDRLLDVSRRGDWDGWIRFFLRALRESAVDAQAKVKSLLSLREAYIARVRTPRSSILLGTLVENLFRRPSITFNQARDLLGVSHSQAAAHVRRLEAAGILKKVDARRRHMRFVAEEILETIFE